MKMSNTLRRMLALILSFLLLSLAGCSSGTNDPGVQNDTWGGNNGWWPSEQAVESSIFGRNIEYDAWTPADDIVLPVETSEISDMQQIGKTLYFTASDGIYSLSLESGESEKLCNGKFSAAYGESLYVYDADTGALCEYSSGGDLLSEKTLAVKGEDLSVYGFYVTDDYYAFVCHDYSGSIPVVQYNVFDKNTLEKLNSFNGDTYDVNSALNHYFYKGNSLIKAKVWRADERYIEISEVNLESGETTDIIKANLDVSSYLRAYDLVYSPKTDTVIVILGPDDPEEIFSLKLIEFSLSDPDNITRQKFYVDIADNTRYFVSVYENIVSVVCTADNEYRYFDHLNPPESITLACTFSSNYDEIISGFEAETGILVRTVNYGIWNDINRLDIKLMAGDTDFDLFEPAYSDMHKYFVSGMYEDLSKYEGLKQRLDGNLAAGFVSSLGDSYVGIPTYIQNLNSTDVYPEDGSPVTYSVAMPFMIYCIRNIDVTKGMYLDEDGEELYKLLKYLYDNPTGNPDENPFADDCQILSASFIIMNPSSSNKENSVKFLEYMFDALNGEIEGVVPESEQYIDLESTDGVYAYWRSLAWNYIEPINSAKMTISQCDGKNSTIREIAREAAAEVDMRLNE